MLREITEMESMWVSDSSPEYIQFSIKVKPELMGKVVENLTQLLFGLRLKAKDNHYYSTPQIPIGNLPNYIIDCHEAVLWMNENYTKNPSEILTSMAKNDCVIVVSANHSVCSGGYASKCIKLCIEDPKKLFPEGNPTKVATPTTDTYKDLIAEAKKLNPFFFFSKDVTNMKIDVNSPYLTEDTHTPITHWIKTPVEELICFDKEKKRPTKLNESIWSCWPLVVAAYGSIQKNEDINKLNQLSVSSIVDLNRMKFTEKIKDKIDWSCINQVTNVNVYCDFDDDTTMKELGAGMRTCHEKLENEGGMLAYAEGEFSMPDDPNLIGASVSNIGAVVLPGGVVDCFIQSYTSKPESFGGISLVDFSVVTKNRNVFISAIRYQPSKYCSKTVRIVHEGFIYAMKKFDLNLKVRDALKQMVEFIKVKIDDY